MYGSKIMRDQSDQDLQMRSVNIQIQSGLFDSAKKSYAGTLAGGSDGFILSWTQPSDEKDEPASEYRMTYLKSREQLMLERSGSGKLDLCFQKESTTTGYLTIPQGQMVMEIRTLSMTIPDFPEVAGASEGCAGYELVLCYQLLFRGADPTENRLSMKIALETE